LVENLVKILVKNIITPGRNWSQISIVASKFWSNFHRKILVEFSLQNFGRNFSLQKFGRKFKMIDIF
jgi:putative cell wall-binding protein